MTNKTLSAFPDGVLSKKQVIVALLCGLCNQRLRDNASSSLYNISIKAKRLK